MTSQSPASSDERPPPLFGAVPRARRGVLWWLGWAVPVIAAHRLCTPTRHDRVVDPLIARVRFWRAAIGLGLTVGAWLVFGLVPLREIPARFHESFAWALASSQLLVYFFWGALSMVPRGRRWRVAVRARGTLVAYLLVFSAVVVPVGSRLSTWPPVSPAATGGGLWLLLFGGYGGLLLISNGTRTADVNDALPALTSFTLPAIFFMPMFFDPLYDPLPLPLHLLLGMSGSVTVVALACWELRRLRWTHDVRVSDIWRKA